MAVIKYKVCDRCKEEIGTPGKWSLFRSEKLYRFTRYLGWAAQREFELCGKCTEELEEFFGINKV